MRRMQWLIGFMLAGLAALQGARAADNQPPSTFQVYTPTVLSSVPGRTLMVFDWESSSDPENGLLRYRLLIWQDYYVVAEIDNILETHYSFDASKDAPNWKTGVSFGFDVQAIDDAGNRVFGWQSSPYSSTRPSGTASVMPAYVWGYIYNSITGSPVDSAVVYTKNTLCQTENGAYGVQVQPGTVEMTVSAPGYTDFVSTLSVAEGEVVLRNIALRKENASGRAVVWGYVKDMTVDMPVAQATVYVDDVPYPASSGSFMITVNPGTRRFRCTAPGFAAAETVLTLANEEFRNETLRLSATSEHLWAERSNARLALHLSGTQGAYDLYIVAVFPGGACYSLRSVPYVWQAGVLPMASNVPLFTATYQLQINPDSIEDTITGATIVASLTTPGANPMDSTKWVAVSTLDWDLALARSRSE